MVARSFNVVLQRSAAAVDDASRVVGCRTTRKGMLVKRNVRRPRLLPVIWQH